jgi:hypothetical protein
MVKISLSIDGADLFKDRAHISAGIKISDPCGAHPVTKHLYSYRMLMARRK